VLVPFADDLTPVDEVTMGRTAILVGLKHTATGDTLVAQGGRKSLAKAVLDGVPLPSPVYTVALEPPSASAAADLDNALAVLSRDDPSLVVEASEDSGQTLVHAMGELHVEVLVDRLRREWKVDVHVAGASVSLREAFTAPVKGHTFTYDRELGGRHLYAALTVDVEPLADAGDAKAGPVAVSLSKEAAASLTPEQREAAQEGLEAACARGPIAGSPLVGGSMVVTAVRVGDAATALGAIRACAAGIVRSLAAEAAPVQLEPRMSLEVSVPDAYVGPVLTDLSVARKADVSAVDVVETPGTASRSLVHATAPLSALFSYASALRSMSAGEASFAMEFESWGPVREQSSEANK